MEETQDNGQKNSSEQEFEYIEVEEGQELPEGYEYEYIEVPADNVSEMDVVNRPHAFSDVDDEDDMASVSEISATLKSSQQEEIRKEAPFPSFLQAGYVEGEDKVDTHVSETKNTNASVSTHQAEKMVNVTDVEILNKDVGGGQKENHYKESEVDPQNVSPVDEDIVDDIHFVNQTEDNDNWQEDTRASYDSKDVAVKYGHDLEFKKNDVSSMNVNDYLEPGATYAAADVAVTELPDYNSEKTSKEIEKNVAENISVSHLAAEKEVVVSKQEQSLDIGISDAKEISLDALLHDDSLVSDSGNALNVVKEEKNGQENDMAKEKTNIVLPPQISEPKIVSLQTQEKALSETEVDISVEKKVEITNDGEMSLAKNTKPDLQQSEQEIKTSENKLTENNTAQENKESKVENNEISKVAESLDKMDEVRTENVEQVQNIESQTDVPTDVKSEEDKILGKTPEQVESKESLVANDADMGGQKSESHNEQQENLLNVSEKQEEKNEPSVLLHSNDEVEQINPSPMGFDVVNYKQEEITQAEFHAYLASKHNGIQFFKANDEVSDILLTDIDFSQHELNAWNLILFQQNIIPLEKKVAELSLPKKTNINRYVSVVQGGNKKIDLCNEDNLKIINASNACVAVQGRFICGDFETNSGVIVNDFMPIPLADFEGKKISFSKPTSGLLTGLSGCVLFFFGVKNIWIPNTDVEEIDAQKLQYKISKWYSGTANDKYFEFSAQSESSEFVGNDEMKAIHVNVSNSSYGWNVTFDNGLSMNLRDLREYQTRFGKIPSANGTISYGQKKLKFQNVERIVVYEAAQYFFYN